MGTPYSAMITLIVTAGVLNIIMGLYALSGRSKLAMVKPFFVFSMLASIYTFGAALELSSNSLHEIQFWIKFEYLGMPFLPPLNLLIILSYLGMERYLRRPLLIGMFAIPVVTMLLVMTNEMHHLYYRDIGLHSGISSLKVDVVAGPWYIIQGAYTFACMIGGVILLLRSWHKMPSYRFQLNTMLIGLVLPLIGDFLYLGGLTPDGMDPIPVIMTLTSALYLWALTSKGLFHVAPIARDNLFSSMREGVLVLDLDNRLVDFNPAATVMMPELSPSAIGGPLLELWHLHTTEPIFGMEQREGRDAEESDIQEIRWQLGDQSFNYQIRSSVVRNQGGREVGRLIVLIDVTERTRLQEELRQGAYYDGLTRIYNRAHFMKLSCTLLSQAVRSREPMAILLFDIDHFKRINDVYGHDMGDQALLHIVELSRQSLRSEDLFARYGGEEFVIAMPGRTTTEAEAAAQRIRAELRTQPMATPQGPLFITASFGIASIGASFYNSTIEVDAEEVKWDAELKRLLKLADRALYEAKHSGRNTIRVSDEEC
ncbi:diguanylate cyclase [Virgibacillus sp. LDC1]|nr:diguanylate cyclase [Virgibacillus sp. LDC1]